MTAREVAPLAFPSDVELVLPGSKSEANRLLVLAALSGRKVRLVGVTPSDDVRHLVSGLATLGFYAALDDESETAQVGPRRPDPPRSGALSCGNAGTATRFLMSVAAITPGVWDIQADERMRSRPMRPLAEAWRALGVDVEPTEKGWRVSGGRPSGGAVTVDGRVSSQFLSSLLLVGAALPRGLEIEVTGPLASRSYAALTARAMQTFGVRVELGDLRAKVTHGYGDTPSEVTVGGDWSAMGAWSCINQLTSSRIQGGNLRRESGQADEALQAVLDASFDEADRTIDVAPMPDQFLNLACYAALRAGTTRLVGAENVRAKECDRVAVIARELRRCGADLDVHDGGVTIRGGAALRGAVIDPEGDHRVAMALAVVGAVVPGITVLDAGCVAKSYPSFWDDLDRVRLSRRPIALVGMRGAGKSTLGRALADHLDARFVDADEVFEQQHGSIASFVDRHSWATFRELELDVLDASLEAGAVIATGGGVVETAAARRLLRARAHVVYVEAPTSLLVERIAESDRPSLTGRPITDEVEDVLGQRAPYYREIAHRTVDATLPLDGQIDRAKQQLR